MIHVFCGRKGSGKTKALIKLANEKVDEVKGNIVILMMTLKLMILKLFCN